MSMTDSLTVEDVRRLADAIRHGDRPLQVMLRGRLRKKLALVDPRELTPQERVKK